MDLKMYGGNMKFKPVLWDLVKLKCFF